MTMKADGGGWAQLGWQLDDSCLGDYSDESCYSTDLSTGRRLPTVAESVFAPEQELKDSIVSKHEISHLNNVNEVYSFTFSICDIHIIRLTNPQHPFTSTLLDFAQASFLLIWYSSKDLH